MFQKMFWIESKKIFLQPVLWIEAIVLALVAAVIPLLLYGAGQFSQTGAEMEALRGSLTWPGVLAEVLNMAGAPGLGGLLVVILAGSAVTQEYQWRTLHFWLSRGVPRGAYLLARFASLLAPALLLAAAALLAGGLSSLGLSLATGGAARLDLVNWFQLAAGMLRAAYTLLPYAALALLLGVATRAPAATIGVGIVLALLVENLLAQLLLLAGGPLAGLVTALPMYMANILLEQNAAIAAVQPAGPGAPSASLAALGLAVYTLALLGLAYWKLRGQDLAG